jgi:hypothetical protein
MAAANAIRVTLTGGPSSPIFAQFLGQATSPASITVAAIAWNAPTATEHDCIKPISMPYSSLIAILDTAEGQRANFPLDSLRNLNAVDLDSLRAQSAENPSFLLECLTLATNPAAPCGPGSLGPTGSPAAIYTPARVYPAAAGSLTAQLQAPCTGTDTLGQGDPIDTASVVNGFAYDPGGAYAAADQWCTLYGNPVWTPGTTPCLMKLAFWQNAAIAGRSTDGLACSPAAPCPVVRAIVPYIITSITPAGAIEGYPTMAIDEAAIGSGFPPTPFRRAVLVQ